MYYYVCVDVNCIIGKSGCTSEMADVVMQYLKQIEDLK